MNAGNGSIGVFISLEWNMIRPDQTEQLWMMKLNSNSAYYFNFFVFIKTYTDIVSSLINEKSLIQLDSVLIAYQTKPDQTENRHLKTNAVMYNTDVVRSKYRCTNV